MRLHLPPTRFDLSSLVTISLVGLATIFSFQFNKESRADSAMASGPSPIQYRISFRQADTHRAEIEATFPVEGASTVDLMMPVWTPGSYLVREYARQVETIEARNGATNTPLSIEKSTKNRWRVAAEGASEIVVRYSLYCHEMGVRNNWVEKDYAFLTGAATFITRVDMQERAHVVRLDALPSWPQIATSLHKESGDPWVRIAKDFSELVDSPILLGDIDIQSFEVGGVTHHLATLGADGLWNTQKAAEDVKKIVAEEQKFWGVIPYQDYWILNLVTETGGGLEHDNSTVLMTSRWAMRQRPKYLDWLGLVSHEFFHTWNVRRLRPQALKNYDFESEQYFRELWVAEGITSYYDDLIVRRSGLSTPKEYLDGLNKTIAGVQTTPGRLVQSLNDSSFDTWVKFYRPDENAINSRISYYTKGSIIALLLDTEIRSSTNNERSLDDVMRRLWSDHLDQGYTTADVQKIANEVAGKDLSAWFTNSLETTRDPNFETLLQWYGLEWKPKSEPSSDGKAAEPEKPVVPYVGLELSNQQGKVIVDKVLTGTPAANAGINVGDELIALDRFRITAEGWAERLTAYLPGDSLDCVIARRGKIATLKLTLAAPPQETWTLQRVKTPTGEQETRWKAWLGIPEETPNP